MIRAFLGLELPETIRSALAVEQFLLPLPRRVELENLHLTLAFLGEVPEPVLEDLHAALSGLRFAGFDMALAGIGHFGGERPRAVWAGVADCPPLIALQSKVERIAVMAGIKVDRRRFLPHVTLGRFDPPAPDQVMRLERAIAERALFRTPPFRVEAVVMFRSHLRAKGAQYEELARYPLT